ncbi:MAG: NfeD family protein [Bacilli bacterium]|nr:NfeD family protein [Bacilli bacterium]
MEQYMWIIWLSVFVIGLIVEAIGTDLVSVWFSGGALIALIISFIPEVAWWVEVIVFVVVSAVCLLTLRPLTRKYMRGKIVSSNADALIGKKGMLLEKVGPMHRGVCQLGDVKWTALGLEDDTKIEAGKVVEVVAISGNKLIVREAELTAEGE